MARSSLSKTSAKLYLSRRAIDAIAEIILMSNDMAELRQSHSNYHKFSGFLLFLIFDVPDKSFNK